jgi:hypothetical protein
MKPYRGLLIGFIVAGLVLANSPSYAKFSGRALLPDLVVTKLDWSVLGCVQSHLLRVKVHVEIKNQGSGTAIWPQRGFFGLWPDGPWFQIWSQIWSQTEVIYWGYFWKELKPGHYVAWDTFLLAEETMGNMGWSTNIGVKANPNHTIKESNYKNNIRGWTKFFVPSGYCP